MAGTESVISPQKIEPINLLYMLDPNYEGKRIARAAGLDWSNMSIDGKYEYAYTAFNEHGTETLRNNIQDRIKQAADMRCESYKRMLFLTQANGNFDLGIGSTVAGILGPLFGERGAKNLAATAGILGGYRAEMNQDYFYNLTATVIAAGITQVQAEIYSKISTARSAKLDKYSMQKAVSDMIVYDDACSAISGMQEAQSAIHLVADPGLDAANRILLKANITNQLMQNLNINEPEKLAAMQKNIQDAQASPLMSSIVPATVGAMPDAGAGNDLNAPLAVMSVLPGLQYNSNALQLLATTLADGYFSGTNDTADQTTRDAVNKRLGDAMSGIFAQNTGLEDMFNKTAAACVNKLAPLAANYANAQATSKLATSTDYDKSLQAEQMRQLSQQAGYVRSALVTIRMRIDSEISGYQAYVAKAYSPKPATAPAVDAKSLPALNAVDKKWASDAAKISQVLSDNAADCGPFLQGHQTKSAAAASQ
ncbi:MAG TPA: hypothetical protein VF798_15465 [Burkholderiaceae bacterium]